MGRLLLAVFVLAVVACDESFSGPTAPIDQVVVLAPGESATVDQISVRFLRVVSDSRCPADVVCVWAGDAHVQIAVSSSDGEKDYDLHTADRKPTTHDGYTIQLVKVEPYPYTSKTIEPDEYRVTLKVTK